MLVLKIKLWHENVSQYLLFTFCYIDTFSRLLKRGRKQKTIPILWQSKWQPLNFLLTRKYDINGAKYLALFIWYFLVNKKSNTTNTLEYKIIDITQKERNFVAYYNCFYKQIFRVINCGFMLMWLTTPWCCICLQFPLKRSHFKKILSQDWSL